MSVATKPKTHRKGNPRTAASQASKESRISDVSVESLIFASDKQGLSVGVTDALEDGVLEETMHGASGLTLSLLDRDHGALSSGLFATRVVTIIDGAPFRLTKVSLPEGERLQALFEHQLVAEMREHTSPLKVRRGKVTRAEFVLMMLRELKLPYTFVCPELHRQQKTPAPEKTTEVVTTKTGKKGTKTTRKKKKVVTNLAEVGKAPSVGPTVSKSPTKALTAKGVPITHAQAAILQQALEAAHNVGANALSMAALVVALIMENDISNPDPGTPGDKGVLSIDEGSNWRSIRGKNHHNSINPFDITEVCEHFCVAGWTGAGGSNAFARQNPRNTATNIAFKVQGPAVEYSHSSESEARAIVAAYLGTGLPGAEAQSASPSFSGEGANAVTQTVVKTATYEFTRGTPGQIESTFECCLRLAEEVNWHFFISGKDEIYFVNDDDLLRAEPRYVIAEGDPGFESLSFDVEVGARTVIAGHKRQPKPSEATLTVRADLWHAPPGCVVRLDGFGPADHSWLVDSVTRSLYDARTTIQLRAPQHPLEEPRATASGTGEPGKEIIGGGGGSSASASAELRPLEVKIQKAHPELKVGVRRVIAQIIAQFPDVTIGTTTNHHRITGTGVVSYHVTGRAADLLASPARMNEVGTWATKNIAKQLTEGIHNPTLSVKNGAQVPPSFWGVEWANHFDHVHVAVA